MSSEVDIYVKQQLRKVLNIHQRTVKIIFGRQFLGELKPDWMERRAQAVEALARAGTGYWYPPYGEPEWITIPAGEFWMGGSGEYDGKPAHKLYLPKYLIARVPVTNAQYALFVKATNYKPPPNWDETRPPKETESHPVVNVSWDDVVAYCAWLSKAIGKTISLPSEAEWEKAARGHQDQRVYPWGNDFSVWYCNTRELGLGCTTSIGIFLEGASPYGLLDMSGNVWEWTRTLADVRFKYPYKIEDGREEVKNHSRHVLRGGSFNYDAGNAHCACRNSFSPLMLDRSVGFRIMMYPHQNISS